MKRINLINWAKKKDIYFWYLTFLTFVAAMPLIAPILSALGLHAPAKVIYFIYSFTCHQFHSRSLYVFDYQYAWCARDSGIWISFWLSALLISKGLVKQIKWYYLPLFVIPIALDGGIQTLNTFKDLNYLGFIGGEGYYSNNLIRFITGAVFGFGLSNFFSFQILKASPQRLAATPPSKGGGRRGLIRVILFFLIIFLTYFSLVTLWSITSPKNQPTNVLDSVPKIQDKSFFERRRNGECPTLGQKDLFAVDCFFGIDD